MLPGLGGDPRQMAMMMRKMGIEMRDIPDVQEVVVRTPTKEYRFAKASVSVMKAQGQETWQVSGKPTVTSLGDAAAALATNVPRGAVPPPANFDVAPPAPAEPYAPTEEDIRTVAQAANVPARRAREALVETQGDLAEAIVRLQG